MKLDSAMLFVRECPIGTGVLFTGGNGHIWTLRARVLHFEVYTMLSEGVVSYTIVDWECGVRGPLNAKDPKTVKRIGKTWGEDSGIDDLVSRLGDRRRVWGVAADNNVPVGIVAIYPEYKKVPPVTVQEPSEPGNELVHVGGLPRLTKADRCDRCGAQAFVAVRLKGGQRLDFCAHHYTKHQYDLLTRIDAVVDQREELTAK